MRWMFVLVAVQLSIVSGCRGLPQPVSMPSAMKTPESARLPDAFTTPVGQLVFHSDFALPADHRLVRELTLERDDIVKTLGLTPSNESINVYLFRDAEQYQL